MADPSDLWSAAFQEAIESFGKDIDVAILKGKNLELLFKELEEVDNVATQESAFLRGAKYLHSIKVPLENFKIALDMASPITGIEPTVRTVFGVVSSVTAVSSHHCTIKSHDFTSVALLTHTHKDSHQSCKC